MNTASNPRSWLIADISIASATLWLCWWRWSLPPQAGPDSVLTVWGTWTPVAVLPALVVVAAIIGAIRPSAGGFLPYALRWVFAAVSLGLLAWIGTDLTAAPTRVPKTLATVGVSAEREAKSAMESAPSPERRRRLEQAMHAAQVGTKLGVALERAQESGVDVPGTNPRDAPEPTSETAEPSAANGGIEMVTALLQEYGDELAAGTVPDEVASFLADAGLDEKEILQQAALFLASKAIAYYFGAPYVVVFEILVALLDDGELTLGELVRLGTAVGMSITPSGGLDIKLLARNFEHVGVQAAATVTLMEALDDAGIEVPKELIDLAKEAAGQRPGDTKGGECDDGALEQAYVAAGCKSGPCERKRFEELLRHSEVEACRLLGSTERQELASRYLREHPPGRPQGN